MQAIIKATKKSKHIASVEALLNNPANATSGFILTPDQHLDFQVLIAGSVLEASSTRRDQPTEPASFAKELLKPACDAVQTARWETEYDFRFGGLSLLATDEPSDEKGTFDLDSLTEGKYFVQTSEKGLDLSNDPEEAFLLGEVEMDQLPKIADGKGHTVLTKGVRMIRRVGKFFC